MKDREEKENDLNDDEFTTWIIGMMPWRKSSKTTENRAQNGSDMHADVYSTIGMFDVPMEVNFQLFDKEYRHRKLRILAAMTLMNPFGPTLSLIATFEDESKPGEEATLYLIMFHPTMVQADRIGWIVYGNRGFKAEEIAKLSPVFQDINFDFVFAGTWMNAEDQETLYRCAYAEDDDLDSTLDLVRRFPNDIFARFDEQMQSQASGSDGSSNKAIENVINLLQDKSFCQREFEHLIKNWNGCENFFLGERCQFSIKTVNAYLAENAMDSFDILIG